MPYNLIYTIRTNFSEVNLKLNETQVIRFTYLNIFDEEKQNAFLIFRKLMNADDKNTYWDSQ